MSVTYLDASAIVKLVVVEAESLALRRHVLRYQGWSSSTIAQVEVRRAVAARQPLLLDVAELTLGDIDFIDLDESILRQASTLPPAVLRSLDAIHIASALALGDALEALVTYDRRMAEAATSLGIRVVAPA